MNNIIGHYKLALDTVYEVSRILSASHIRDSALQNSLSVLERNLNMKRGMIFLYDEIEDTLKVTASLGIPSNVAKNLRYKRGEGIVGQVFKFAVPILVPDISEEPLFLNKAERDLDDDKMSFYGVPLVEENKRYGVLAVDKNVEDVCSYHTEFNLLKMISQLFVSFIKKTEALSKEITHLESEKIRLEKEVIDKFKFQGLIGQSKVMKHVFEKIHMVAKSKSPVLIRGESGTGKEIIAKTIHYNSERAKKPFIAINCAAIPHELMESELFGYEKGAFTGAANPKKGKFEAAEGGTIFLDEIGEMPAAAQTKLLRVIQEKQLQRLGGNTTINLDVRVIAATNRDLEKEIQEGTFRLDLYYRLNVFTIFLPPLRKRKEDIPMLVQHIVSKLNKEYQREVDISPSIMSILTKCKFPGNIRELENCLERAYFSCTDNLITISDFSCMKGDICYSHIIESAINKTDKEILENTHTVTPHDLEPYKPKEEEIISKNINGSNLTDKELVVNALEKTGWVQAKAARMLGMTVRQINYRIAKYNIEIQKI